MSAYDVKLIQEAPAGGTYLERTVAPTACGFIGLDASKLPIAESWDTFNHSITPASYTCNYCIGSNSDYWYEIWGCYIYAYGTVYATVLDSQYLSIYGSGYVCNFCALGDAKMCANLDVAGCVVSGGGAAGVSTIAAGLTVNNTQTGTANDDFIAKTLSQAAAFQVDASADTICATVPMITSAGVTRAVTTLTSSTTLTTAHHVVRIDASLAAVTATLPATPAEGQEYRITVVDDTNTVTIAPNGNNLYGATDSVTLIAWETLILHYDSTNGWA